MSAAAKVPVERLALRWVEVLDDDYEIIRVLRVGDASIMRVVPHRVAWRVECRMAHTNSWRAESKGTGSKWGARSVRTWRTPAAAMAAAEKMFRDRAGLQPGDPQEKKR